MALARPRSWTSGCWTGWSAPGITWSARRPASRRSCSPRQSPAPRSAPSHHGWMVSRLADALYRTGDAARAAQVANQALDFITEPDLLVDLHWTLAQCRIRTGQSAESLATLDRALDDTRALRRHRARLLVVAARTHSHFGEFETAEQVATSALAAAHRGGRQLGHGLGVARAVAGDSRAGPADRIPAALRPGADRHPGRPGADRPAAAAADQQGGHARQPRPVRRGSGRGQGGAATRGPGRHGGPAGSGALRPGAVPLRDGPLGRRAGRGGQAAGEPAGAGRGVLRPRHGRRDQLPSWRGRRGARPPCGRGPVCRAARAPAHPAAGARPQPGP